MRRATSRLDDLTTAQAEAITRAAGRRRNIPLVKIPPLKMCLDAECLGRARLLARVQGLSSTDFLSRMIREDVDRLWGVFQRALKKRGRVA